jgi:hypothetical protein
MIEYLSLPATVEAVALSNVSGKAKLRILKRDPARSTIERDNILIDDDGSERSEIIVPTRRLDDYSLRDVGLIKVDVEGQGFQTIQRCHPTLLIEIEERHKTNSISDVQTFLSNLEYHGYFLPGRDLLPMSAFEISLHQNKANIGGEAAVRGMKVTPGNLQ